MPYPLNNALSELEFEDLDSREDTGRIVSLCHGVNQHSMEGNTTCVTMWMDSAKEYSGTSDKGPSEIGTTSLQRRLVAAPC